MVIQTGAKQQQKKYPKLLIVSQKVVEQLGNNGKYLKVTKKCAKNGKIIFKAHI